MSPSFAVVGLNLDEISDCAVLLDRLFPLWYREINTDTLNQHDSDLCILGQLCGKEKIGVYAIKASFLLSYISNGLLVDWNNGFGVADGQDTDEAWERVTNQWKKEVLTRMKKDADKIINDMAATKSSEKNGLYTVRFEDGSMMNVGSIKDIPIGKMFTIVE